MIELTNLTKQFSTTPAVDGLSMTIQKGEFCVLIGRSGCGKSTTLKMINRLIEPTQGEIKINNQSIVDLKPELLRRKIGYVIQSIGLFPHWTVAQNIGVVPKLLQWSPEKITARVDFLLERFGLASAGYRDQYPHQLSGGQAQRIGVARALAADPDILLMDEPFGALDPITRESLQIELSRIHKEFKKTIVFVTHDVDEAIRLADKIAIMDQGKLVQFDTPEQILKQPKNQFVHDFIGTDRGLRQLSRIFVRNRLQPAHTLTMNDSLEKAARLFEMGKSIWIVDQKTRKLTGWLKNPLDDLNHHTMESCTVKISPDFPLHEDHDMKEAISRMLWQSVQCLPVVNQDFNLLGEIRFENILGTDDPGAHEEK